MDITPDKDEVADSNSAGPIEVNSRKSTEIRQKNTSRQLPVEATDTPKNSQANTERGVVVGVTIEEAFAALADDMERRRHEIAERMPALKTRSQEIETAPFPYELRPTVVYTYFIQGSRGGPIKIGKAIDVANRVKLLQCGNPDTLRVVGVICKDVESRLHSLFSWCRRSGEWFDATEQLVAYINSVRDAAPIGIGIAKPKKDQRANRIDPNTRRPVKRGCTPAMEIAANLLPSPAAGGRHG